MKNAASVALTYTHALAVGIMTPPANACREDRADFILDRDKANFCDFFTVHTKAYRPHDNTAAQKARAALAEMFGEDLPVDDVDSIQSDQALAELKRLFGESE